MLTRLAALALLLFAVVPGMSGTALGDEASPPDRDAIRAVIEQQLAAFQRDDGDAAFAFASPGIRDQFRTAENFMSMVRGGYAPVYRPREVRFGALETTGGNLVQRVFLVGPDGVPVVALYLMQRQPDGSWKIAGCVLAEPPDTST